MMQKLCELQKVSFEQSIQEVKKQISGALDSLVADADDLKERTKATEEATVNMTFKKRRTQSGDRHTGERNGGKDAKT